MKYLAILTLIIGFVIGLCFESKQEHYKETRGKGVLTSPLLECNAEEAGISEINVSKNNLTKFVQSRYSKDIDHISVYVRDLNNGPWIGINEKEEFIGASLLKVPTMMAVLNKLDMTEKIDYITKLDDTEQYYRYPQIQLKNTYTVEELLESSIKNSDNNATILLLSKLNNRDVDSVFNSLGLGNPSEVKNFPVNVKNYAGFFRVLFNASYLNKEKSEKALDLLTKTNFNEGITKHLPDYVRVAHKFGIREVGDIKQLHDCGIVYSPNHPYLLCIMTKGNDVDEMAKAIADISLFIYKEVTKSI